MDIFWNHTLEVAIHVHNATAMMNGFVLQAHGF